MSIDGEEATDSASAVPTEAYHELEAQLRKRGAVSIATRNVHDLTADKSPLRSCILSTVKLQWQVPCCMSTTVSATKNLCFAWKTGKSFGSEAKRCREESRQDQNYHRKFPSCSKSVAV
jgi:hypothetical protein